MSLEVSAAMGNKPLTICVWTELLILLKYAIRQIPSRLLKP